MQKYFHDQLEGEVIDFVFGRHWIFLVIKTLLFIIAVLFFSLVPIAFSEYLAPATDDGWGILKTILLADFIIVIYLIHNYFLWLISYLATYAIVTNFRIIIVKKSVFLQSEKEMLDLSQIRDIQMKKRGLFCNIFNCGDINLILSTQEKDATVIKHVYNPLLIQSKCNSIRHDRIQKRYRFRDAFIKSNIEKEDTKSE